MAEPTDSNANPYLALGVGPVARNPSRDVLR